ncbi:hypothetical protein BGZ54_008078, partial [Gamsiella multidivaricata]
TDGPMMSSGAHMGHPGPIPLGNPNEFGDTMGLNLSMDAMGGFRRKRAKIEDIE